MARITKRWITDMVVPSYERVIKDGRKDNFSEFLRRLKRNSMELGICYFCRSNYGKDISNHCSVTRRAQCNRYGEEGFLYWGAIPEVAGNKKEAIEALQLRIDILKSWNR